MFWHQTIFSRDFGNVKQRIYIDTSVFGGNFDVEFAKHTSPLFDRLKNDEFTLLYSKVTQDELTAAPENVRELVKSIKVVNTEFLEVTTEAIELASENISEKIAG